MAFEIHITNVLRVGGYFAHGAGQAGWVAIRGGC